MFNIFKRKKVDTGLPLGWVEITDSELTFLKSVAERLPAKYSFLLNQINREFLTAKKPNPYEIGGYSMVVDRFLEKKLRVKTPFYRIGGVRSKNIIKNRYENIFIDILDQILVGFVMMSPVEEYDPGSVQYDFIYEEKAEEPTHDTLQMILGHSGYEGLKDHLNYNNIFEMDLDGRSFYTIHDFGDGNYIAVNTAGEIYGLFHDPYTGK